MKYLLELIIILALSQTVIVVQVKSQTNDFFPLETNLRRVYSYQSEEKKYEDLGVTKLTVDSGIVAFNVLGNSISDSILVWYILETDSIFRNIQAFAPSEGNDTLFLIRSITVFDLSERKSGAGELSSSSNFPVWQFPWYWTNPWGVSRSGGPIYRYSTDTLITQIVERYDSLPFFYFDSLVFRKSIGLVKVFARSYKGPNTLYSITWQATLIDPIVSSDDIGVTVSGEFTLFQNYPNPFNPNTTISYQLPTQSDVILKVFDMLGREITTLVDRVEEPGNKSVTFNANNLASGIYFYRVQAGNYVETRKLLVLQ